MCIFSQPVISVNDTQIFARQTSRETQFLVYQMKYESSTLNAMILPIPVRQPARDESLRFIDLKDYPEFFEDLADGFPYSNPTFDISCSSKSAKSVADKLQVFKVGNYIASFVPGIKDFSRLDKRFTLPTSTWAKIPLYQNYGFAVFQLAAGSLKPHPMAFEFETANDSIYFPTKHIHDGKIHDEEKFDHVLYLQHAGFDSRVYGYKNTNVVDKSTGLIRSKFTAKHFCETERTHEIVSPNLLVHRKFIRGEHPNRDTEITTVGDPENPTLNFRYWLPYAPWVLVGGAITWFLIRRSKIKKMKAAQSDKPIVDKLGSEKQPPQK